MTTQNNSTYKLTTKQGIMAGAFLGVLLFMYSSLITILFEEVAIDFERIFIFASIIAFGIPLMLLKLVEMLLYPNKPRHGHSFLKSGKHNAGVFFGTIISIVVIGSIEYVISSIAQPPLLTDIEKAIIKLGLAVILFMIYYVASKKILEKQR